MSPKDVSLEALEVSNPVGERLRTLRAHAGLTQTELAGDRFSKEYVSQIERGKTRPSREALEYLAERLDVDPLFLETGVSADERSRVEATLARGEALIEEHKFDEALAEFREGRALMTSPVPELLVRSLCGEAWALMSQGSIDEAIVLLQQARDLAERPRFSDLERADIIYRLGCCRYHLSSLQTAIGLFTEALELAQRSGLPCDRLRSDVFRWRSRCYRRQRDWEAAREDVDRALELAESVDDPRTVAHTFLHASLIAERNGHWILARNYAERARAEYERVADRANVGRMLNNLGALNFLLGNPKEAVRLLNSAFSVALDEDRQDDAAFAVSSLARVQLETGHLDIAERHARKALELLDGRIDYLYEIGNAQLVLGRSLLLQKRFDEADEWLRTADASFEQVASPGHRSAALLARGDLAAARQDDADAARLYKIAAELLQDVRF